MLGCPAKVGLLSEGLSLNDVGDGHAKEDIEQLFADPIDVKDQNSSDASNASLFHSESKNSCSQCQTKLQIEIIPMPVMLQSLIQRAKDKDAVAGKFEY